MAYSGAAFFKIRATRPDRRRPDIFDRLKAGHERLRLLTAWLRESRDGAANRRRLFDLLCDAVEAHGAAAEQTFYAELLARSEDQRPTRRAVQVYDEAARLIGELSDMEMADDAWQAGIARLSALLEAHFRAEEGATFALARTLIGGEQATRLGDSYEQVRRQWIEVFGRLPDEPLPVVRPGPLAPAGPNAARRWRPTGWLERLRRPLSMTRPPRSTTTG